MAKNKIFKEIKKDKESFEKISKKKEIAFCDLEKKVKEIKEQNKTIATLNGSFDILHAGHLHIIYEAKKLADVLIVALNSDCSIKKYKKKTRPIIPLKYRMQMISSIEFVDFVTSFIEKDPINILKIIKPDIHVNGMEYKGNCIEKKVVEEFNGKVFFVERVFSLSSSFIIDKIKKCDKKNKNI